MKSKHGDIHDDGCWNSEKMVNQTESYRLFNNMISLCSFSTILWGMLAKQKKPWLGTGWIFSHVKTTYNAQPGYEWSLESNRGLGWYS
jgi:hypothetical protein